jgi:hypothetical protein
MSSYNNQNDYVSSTTETCCEYEPLSKVNDSTFSARSGAFKSSGLPKFRTASVPVKGNTNQPVNLDNTMGAGYGMVGKLSSAGVGEMGLTDSEYVTFSGR